MLFLKYKAVENKTDLLLAVQREMYLMVHRSIMPLVLIIKNKSDFHWDMLHVKLDIIQENGNNNAVDVSIIERMCKDDVSKLYIY